MAGRVAVYSPEGQFGTVDEADAAAVTRAGGRIATKQELAQRAADEEYAKASLAEKATSLASIAGPAPFAIRAGVKLAQGRGAELAPTLPPELQAYAKGVGETMTLDLAPNIMKKAVEVAGGKKAAEEYVRTTNQAVEANPGFHTAGQVAGVAGTIAAGGAGAGLGKAGAAIPGIGVGTLGGSVEALAARGLAGVAKQGIVGRALATGGALAARGAVEGALIGGANAIGDAQFNDHELVGEKLWSAVGSGFLIGGLGGGALGFGGSLAASGVKAGVQAGKNALTRVLTPAEEAGAQAAKAGEGLLAKAAEPAQDLLAKARSLTTDEGVRGLANQKAFDSLGAGKGLIKEAERKLPGGIRDVGETMLRHGVHDANGGVIDAAMKGTPQALLERIELPLASVGQKLGAMTDASGGRVSGIEIGKAISEVAAEYEGAAATRPIGRQVRKFAEELRDSLGLKDLDSTVSVQDLLRERKALGRIAFEGGLDPSAAQGVKRELTAKLEGLVEKSLDEASGKVPGTLKGEYLQLKKDYTALRIARDAAEDAAARGAQSRPFSLTDKIVGSAVGAAGSLLGGPLGGLIAGPGAAFVSKIVRERGDAAAAVFLHKLADMGTVTKMLARVDEQIGSAAKGLLSAPKPQPLPAGSKEPVMQRAQRIMARVAEARSDPQAFADRVTRETEALGTTAPKVASAYTATALRAAEFLATKMPPTSLPDPLDPTKPPRISQQDAAKVAQYGEYVERPTKFFEEVAQGKLTRAGVETARALMPRAFAELQVRMAEALTDLQLEGKKPPFAQRERIGILMDIPAVASQRPDHMLFLQANVQATPDTGKLPPDSLAPPAPPKRPIRISPQQNPLDRLEGK